MSKVKLFLDKFPKQGIINVFFVFIFSLLFIGEAKQSFAEAIAGLGALAIFIGSWLTSARQQEEPPFRKFWIVATIAYAVKTLFSDSLAYSLSATIRFVEGYLVYAAIFYASTDRLIAKYAHGIKYLSLVAIVISLLFTILAWFLPENSFSNFLYASGGHNYLANLLLFVLPLVTFEFIYSDLNSFSWVFGLFTFSLVLTFARGALILGASYLLYLFFTVRLSAKNLERKKFFLIFSATAFTVVVSVVLVMSLLFNVEQMDVSSSWWQRQIIKRPLARNERIEYWRQALKAISERPLWGSGPGTFYLQSKRLQSKPVSYAWYAHNQFLQTLVEFGFIGSLPIFVLFAVVVAKLVRNYKECRKKTAVRFGYQRALTEGVLLTVVYSFFEFNLDFIIIWLLFWGTCGQLLSNLTNETKQNKSSPGIYEIAIGPAVLLFSLLSLFGAAASTIFHDRQQAYFFTPFSVKNTINFLSDLAPKHERLDLNQERAILFFHRRDPEVLFALARAGESGPDPKQVESWYHDALFGHPANSEYLYRYANYLLARGEKQKLGAVFAAVGTLFGDRETRRAIEQIAFQNPEITASLSPSMVEQLRIGGDSLQGLAKAYYFLGLTWLKSKPELTLKFWTAARGLSPQWDYYHLELASLETYVFHDAALAKKTLGNCRKYFFPQKSCEWFLQNIDRLTPPGYYYEQVRLIPQKPD